MVTTPLAQFLAGDPRPLTHQRIDFCATVGMGVQHGRGSGCNHLQRLRRLDGELHSDPPPSPPVTSFDGSYRTTIRTTNTRATEGTIWCNTYRTVGRHCGDVPLRGAASGHPGQLDPRGRRHVLWSGHRWNDLRPGSGQPYGGADRRVGVPLHVHGQAHLGRLSRSVSRPLDRVEIAAAVLRADPPDVAYLHEAPECPVCVGAKHPAYLLPGDAGALMD